MERNYILGNQVIFDVLKREIVASDGVVNLGGREAAILKLLCEQSNQVLSKDDIHEQVWGKVQVSETSLTKAISNLRKSFTLFSQLACEIKTVPKEGYILILDEEAVAQVSVEYIPTLAVKSVVSSTKPVMSFPNFNSVSESVSFPIRKTFWFAILFFVSLLTSVLTNGIQMLLNS
ncbi:winged helix-turn-helix domain-containing protein [Vibrio mediterranei]|uniref:Helix-turn-helix domain-containing protein n=1 Tax=Vibrio mediterranei TaxID=689 RepID=A0A3G4VM52_9VIBR|nr:winged helix-turn-helix domain-containing protein [Vibrio mediterranei]AYV25078.1 helix-turn-helix domain-containing protein [Vibrio mediterranei]MCG9790504.1 winged helix-turn-helix domain-containing protein [Vibrio mediterranei]